PGSLINKEAHRRFERGLFLRWVVGPDGPVFGGVGAGKASIDAKEIFEALARERIALHVEEKIAGIGRGKQRKAAARRERQQFERMKAGPARFELEPRLG